VVVVKKKWEEKGPNSLHPPSENRKKWQQQE